MDARAGIVDYAETFLRASLCGLRLVCFNSL